MASHPRAAPALPNYRVDELAVHTGRRKYLHFLR